MVQNLQIPQTQTSGNGNGSGKRPPIAAPGTPQPQPQPKPDIVRLAHTSVQIAHELQRRKQQRRGEAW